MIYRVMVLMLMMILHVIVDRWNALAVCAAMVVRCCCCRGIDVRVVARRRLVLMIVIELLVVVVTIVLKLISALKFSFNIRFLNKKEYCKKLVK